jgi:hypothetical protein
MSKERLVELVSKNESHHLRARADTGQIATLSNSTTMETDQNDGSSDKL